MGVSKRSYSDMMLNLADEYLAETGASEATATEMAAWAIRNGHWDPPANLVLRQCREDFARAMREEHFTGGDGKPIRAKHVARVTRGGKQQHLWADIRKAPRQHMEIAFQQRREQIVGDCRQLNRDVEYYNEVSRTDTPIQMLFDFRDDVEEGEYPGTYPSRKPTT